MRDRGLPQYEKAHQREQVGKDLPIPHNRGEKIMRKLICHADECDNSTSETFFHCEQHGGEDGEEE